MHKIGVVVAATVIGFSINMAGCEKKNDMSAKNFNADRHFSNLKTEKFVIKTAEAFDIDAVISALPSGLAIEYTRSDFDATSGATVLTDVKLSAVKNPDIGISVKEVLIWGGDSAGIVDRLQGRRMDQVLPVVTRVEASHLKLYGLEAFMQPLFDASNAMTDVIVKGDPDLENLDVSVSLDTYEFSMGKVIWTDFVLYPSVLELVDLPGKSGGADNELSDKDATVIWHWFQRAANYSSMISYSDFAIYDGVFDLAMTQYGQPTQMSGSVALMGYKDVHRGDIGYALTKNMSYDMDVPTLLIEGKENAPDQLLKMHTITERTIFKDIRLAKAMDHLARGVMPARSDTDFMSLGVWTTENSIAKFNGTKLYSADSMTIDMGEFHWLIPEIISMRAENVKYDLVGFAGYMETSMGAEPSTNTEALDILDGLAETMEKVTGVLKKYNMEEPSLDFNFAMKWDGDTGLSAFHYGFGIDDFTRFEMKLDAIIPNYNAFMNIIPDDFKDMDKEALQTLFLGTAKLKKYTMQIKDEGGLDKGFAMAKDFAALTSEDSREATFLRLNSPEQLREMAAASPMLAASFISKSFPPAVDYLQAASNFIREGGELTLSIMPPNPVSIDDLKSISKLIQTDPDEAVDKFGISVAHKP